MKILHLGDLHIGKKVNGYSMISNQKKIFEQIYEVIKDKKIEVVVIAGDIYDRSMPSETATETLDSFLWELVDRLKVKVVAIGGNHDSSKRLDFSNGILAKQGVYILGGHKELVNRISIGEVDFYLMPFETPSSIRQRFKSIIEETEIEIKDYDDVMSFLTKEAVESFQKDRINIAIYHGFVIGSIDDEEIKREESVKVLSLGGKESVSVNYFKNFDYTALGHIHSSRRVGKNNIRYAGSPLKYSFSEKDHKKKLTIVDITKNKCDIELIDIIDPYPMVEIKGSFDEVMKADIPTDAYLKVILTENILDAMSKLRVKYSQIMELSIEIETSDSIDKKYKSESVSKIAPDQLFSDLAMSVGIELTEKELKIVRNTVDAILEEGK